MKRRTFICATAAMALSSTTLARSLARPVASFSKKSPYLESLGLNLNSIRNELAMDQANTLQAVADAGFKQVELASTMDGGEVVKISRDLGMAVNSAFFNWKTIVAPDEADVPSIEAVIEKAAELELKYLVLGYIGKGFRESVEKFKLYADAGSVAGEKCREADIQLCYHNHSFEFKPLEEGVSGMDIFIERFHQDLVKFELDLFWAKLGGKQPGRLLGQLDGRVAQVHLKNVKKKSPQQFDENKVPEDQFVELADGAIKYEALLPKFEEIGVEHCHIAQDYSPNPLESMAANHKSFAKLVEVAKEPAKKEGAAWEGEEHGEEHEHDHDHVHKPRGGVF